MTANQINYAKYQEDVRSHLASEDINRRQAAAAERQAAASEEQAQVAAANAVTNRMNAETNQQNSLINESAVGAQWYGAQANAAYQQAMAAVSQAQQQESVRHNKTSEYNDILKSGRETTAKNYATQKQYESSVYATDKHYQEVELQTRAGLVGTGVKSVTDLLRARSSLIERITG